MSQARTKPDTPAIHRTPIEVLSTMPESYIVIFLLFFAVLAFAWFYMQRAKGRTDAGAAAKPAESPSAEQTDHSD